MDQFLKGLYGSTDDDDEQGRVSKANDFVSRVESGNKAEGYSTEEAVQNYKNVTSGLSDDEFESIAADAMRQLTPDQRREFTQVVKQQAGIDLDDNMDDPQELAALTKQFRSGSNDLGGLLSGLLGGGGAGGSSDDIMGMLGGLLGGGSTGAGQIGGTGASSQAGLSGLLGNPIVKMVLGLIAAEAMKRFMGGRSSQPAQAGMAPPVGSSQAGSGGGGFLDSIFGGGDDRDQGGSTSRKESGNEGGGGFLDSIFGGDDDTPKKKSGKQVDVSRIERDNKPKGV